MTTVVVFAWVLTVAELSSKSNRFSLSVNVPIAFESLRMTKVFPTNLFSVISLFAPAYPTDVVFAVSANSNLTSEFAVGSFGVPRKISPFIVFAGKNGSAVVGVV